MLRNFCKDDNGFIVSAELILIATIMVLGLVVGLVELQASMLHELNELGEAIGSISQSFQIAPTMTSKGGHFTGTPGSKFTDEAHTACCEGNLTADLFCAGTGGFCS